MTVNDKCMSIYICIMNVTTVWVVKKSSEGTAVYMHVNRIRFLNATNQLNRYRFLLMHSLMVYRSNTYSVHHLADRVLVGKWWPHAPCEPMYTTRRPESDSTLTISPKQPGGIISPRWIARPTLTCMVGLMVVVGSHVPFCGSPFWLLIGLHGWHHGSIRMDSLIDDCLDLPVSLRRG